MNAAFAVTPSVFFGQPFAGPALSKRPRLRLPPRHRVTATQKEPSTQPLPPPRQPGLSAATPPAAASASASASAASNGAPPMHTPEDLRKDLLATLGWVTLAAITAGTIFSASPSHGVEFITAYLIEYSLSVDNLFVFLLIFEYFRVPRPSQTRVLTYGIVGAVTMRGVMIVAGEALTHRFKAVTLAFAGLLLFSAVKLLSAGPDDDNLEHNAVVRFAKSLMSFSDRYDADRFFTQVNGRRLATPMLLVLLCIELSDVVFALDSVPAVLGISDDTLVIYLSNILAIAGLRNLYFVLSDAIGDLRFLKQSLAIVLGFVGAKMLAGVAGVEVGVVQSLGVVVGTLAGGIGLSFAFPADADVVESVPPPAEG